jgi:hypothetical protein
MAVTFEAPKVWTIRPSALNGHRPARRVGPQLQVGNVVVDLREVERRSAGRLVDPDIGVRDREPVGASHGHPVLRGEVVQEPPDVLGLVVVPARRAPTGDPVQGDGAVAVDESVALVHEPLLGAEMDERSRGRHPGRTGNERIPLPDVDAVAVDAAPDPPSVDVHEVSRVPELVHEGALEVEAVRVVCRREIVEERRVGRLETPDQVDASVRGVRLRPSVRLAGDLAFVGERHQREGAVRNDDDLVDAPAVEDAVRGLRVDRACGHHVIPADVSLGPVLPAVGMGPGKKMLLLVEEVVEALLHVEADAEGVREDGEPVVPLLVFLDATVEVDIECQLVTGEGPLPGQADGHGGSGGEVHLPTGDFAAVEEPAVRDARQVVVEPALHVGLPRDALSRRWPPLPGWVRRAPDVVHSGRAADPPDRQVAVRAHGSCNREKSKQEGGLRRHEGPGGIAYATTR